MSSGPDPLSASERQRLLELPRPKRRLALLGASRDATLELGRAEDARHRPVYAVWEITLQCDLACRHCGSRAGHARPDELNTEQCLDAVRQMHELGVLEVTLIGGEAYLRDDWAEIARAITDRGMRCTMTTGGRGLDDRRVAQAVAARMSAISVSLDGLAETHDRLRGVAGSHASAIQAMRRVHAAGLHEPAGGRAPDCSGSRRRQQQGGRRGEDRRAHPPFCNRYCGRLRRKRAGPDCAPPG